MHDSGERNSDEGRTRPQPNIFTYSILNPYLQVQKNWVAAHKFTRPTTAQQSFCLDVEPLSHFIIGAAEFTSIQGTVHHWYF